MARIRIKNFGPIKEGCSDNDGWIEIRKVSVFIGNQGGGKSCIAKLISTFTWMEKVLVRGDYVINDFSASKFRQTYCGYHRIENYFFNREHVDVAEIEYEGGAYSMRYVKGNFWIKAYMTQTYHLPQIMYAPTERNFISVIKEVGAFKTLPDSLLEYLTEFNNAKDEIKDGLSLPINNANIEYDKQHDVINVNDSDYKIELSKASSGFQSLVPLYLVSWYLAYVVRRQVENPQKMSHDEFRRFNDGVKLIWANSSLTNEQRKIALSALSSHFSKSAFINIVEEPEQNLFPVSQQNLLYSLLEFNNLSSENQLIITTQSPYVINGLSLAIKAGQVEQKMEAAGKEGDREELDRLVPLKSLLSKDDWIIYEVDNKGAVSKLVDYDGLPSDENCLNELLAETGGLFSELLRLEDRYEK
ncbi:ATP-binding protein [Parabacteroides sp. AM08-6]|uniref:ATP-binding protein n=1 Tax=Parabacteroides sp. AM08-6 TaxID=2292053 RepID=UPI000EFDFBA5|nr:ATP-binding protein [Parabacteroides sp. AM08-6]RHJ82567.1 ATP-binding protein [Parabacteroides sp. AM08-6]